jgi:hypothetical protein
MRISAMIQVGRKFRAGKPVYLSGGIITAPIYGKVQNHWGMLARSDAWYTVDHVRVENGSLDDLRAAARVEIDRRNAESDNIYAAGSTQFYASCYSNTGYCQKTGKRLSA